MSKKIFFSGVQPSGNLHLGNYLGSIKNWVDIQDEYQAICCVVNLHAITVPQDPSELKKKTIEVAKLYLASGLDPRKVIIFRQSDVPQHTELMWLLNTITKTGELFKMTQFKDKSGIQENGVTEKISVGAGLLNYPILMAADILLYDTDLVPVGEDQTQHLELTKTLARRFNNRFGKEKALLKIPEIFVSKVGKKIMSLTEPTKKMSKSAESPNSRIELLDKPEVIRKKIMRAVTDSENKIYYSDKKEKAGLRNLLNIFSIISGKAPEEIAIDYQDKGYGDLKKDLAERLVEYLQPIQEKFAKISDEEVLDIFEKSKKVLIPRAERKITELKRAMGLE